MSAQPAPVASPANPSAWTLRDEIAMRALTAMMGRGGWRKDNGDAISSARDYAAVAYKFADHMLAARSI